MRKENSAPEKDVVISSRVRLARNSSNFPFPSKLSINEAGKMIETCKAAIFNSMNPIVKELEFIDSTKLTPLEKACLVEKHLISPEFAAKKELTGLVLSKDESISIMINEEDHLRIQVIFPGLQLNKSWELCDTLDDLIEDRLEYAYSEELGYLTCCPTNVGTGLRASVMVHLPALTILGYVNNVIDAVSKLGIVVRGIYGEGSEVMGNMYQVSNQVSLGQSEEEIVANITSIANRIIEQERWARNQLLKNKIQLEDRLYRSYGTITNARIMTSKECMVLLSDVRLGVDLNILKDVPIDLIDELIVITQPANLQKIFNTTLTPEERDIKRAELIRTKLAKT